MHDEKDAPTEAMIAELRRRFPTEPSVDAILTAKMRARPGTPYVQLPLAAIEARLRDFLARRLPGSFQVENILPLAGGSSKEQYSFHLRWTEEDRRERHEHLALRMRPRASIVETHPLREFQAIKAAEAVMPVPPLYWVDPEGDEFGQPALIYGFCQGVARPPSKGAYNPRQAFGAHYRELLAPQFVDYFARLATLEWSKADMSAFEPYQAGSNDAVIAAINTWERVWEEDSIEPMPIMTLAADWLRANAPPIDHVSLLHQDFRGGNFLFDPETGKITAILDWELAALGDRHADLAFFLSPLTEQRGENGEILAGGLMEREEFLATYERLTGLPVDPARLRYYMVFAFWRGAVHSVGTGARIVRSQLTHQDARVAWIIGTAPLVLSRMHEALKEQL